MKMKSGSILVLCVCAFVCLQMAALPPDSYDRLAPYSEVRWQDASPEVLVDEAWYDLEAIDGVSVAELVAFTQARHGDLWQKRFDEDLVQVLSEMGHAPGPAVDLHLVDPATGESRFLDHVPMTAENRLRIWLSRNASWEAKQQGYPKLAPYEGIRWEKTSPEVLIDGAWYGLEAIDETPVEDIVAFARLRYGDLWQKRFDEDLVQVLSEMERPPNRVVDLHLVDRSTDEIKRLEQVAMTRENRQRIWASRSGASCADSHAFGAD